MNASGQHLGRQHLGLRQHFGLRQRSMVAARVKEFYEKEAKERQRAGKKINLGDNCPEPPKSRAHDNAGKAMGVSIFQGVRCQEDRAERILAQMAGSIFQRNEENHDYSRNDHRRARPGRSRA